MGIEEALEDYEGYLKISTNSAITTISKYRNIVRLMLLDLKLQISLPQINKWIAKKNRSKSTYAYKYAIMHYLISIGRKDWADKLIKAKKQKRQKTFPVVSRDKMNKIINMLSPMSKKIAFIQIKTGARFAEAVTIRAENIDFNLHEELIYIKIGVNKSLTKGSKEGNLRLSKRYENMLRGWMQKPYGYLFLDNKWENRTPEDVIKHIDNIRRKLGYELAKCGKYHGVEKLSTHYLRHLFADYFMLSKGSNSFALQSIMRHSEMKTTASYISVEDELVDKLLVNMEER